LVIQKADGVSTAVCFLEITIIGIIIDTVAMDLARVMGSLITVATEQVVLATNAMVIQ